MKNKPNLSIHWRSLAPKDNRQVYHIQLPVAVLVVELSDGVICQSEWLCRQPNQDCVDYPLNAYNARVSLLADENRGEGSQHEQILGPNKALLDRVFRVLHTPETSCELPVLQQGSAFRQRVWIEISQIPLGETVSYKTLAECLESSPRAVANACRDNPLPGIIPCHRVVSVNGIGGFMGQSEGVYVDLKRALLHYEQRIKTHHQPANR